MKSVIEHKITKYCEKYGRDCVVSAKYLKIDSLSGSEYAVDQGRFRCEFGEMIGCNDFPENCYLINEYFPPSFSEPTF